MSDLELSMYYTDPGHPENTRVDTYELTKIVLPNGMVDSERAEYLSLVVGQPSSHHRTLMQDQVPGLPGSTKKIIESSLKLSLSVDHQLLVVNIQSRNKEQSKRSNFIYIFDMHVNPKELGQRPTLVWSASDSGGNRFPGLYPNNIEVLDTFISTENPGVLILKAKYLAGGQGLSEVDFFAQDTTNRTEATKWSAMKSLGWTNIAEARAKQLSQSPDLQVLPGEQYGPMGLILQFAGLRTQY